MKIIKSFFKRIKEFFLDIRDDWMDMWRGGPVRFFQGLRRDTREWFLSLTFWWKDRGKKKLTEEERLRVKELKAKRKREAFLDLKENLGKVAKSPWTLATSLWRGILRLRQLSFREQLAELWRLYLSLIATLLNGVSTRWQRFQKRPMWLRVSLSVLLLLILSGAVASPWLLKEVKHRRAQEMLTEAKALQEKSASGNVDDMVEAFRISRAAALMQPDNPEALEIALELANNIGAPEAIWWSERAAVVRGFDQDSLDRVVETALRHRRIDKAERSLMEMKSRFPEKEGLAENEVELLLARKSNIEAMQRALLALESGADSPLLHTTAVGLGLFSSAEHIRTRMHTHLLQNLYRQDEVGIALARLVLTRGIRLSDDQENLLDYERLIDFIEGHELATAVDRVAAYSMGLRLGIIEQSKAEENILKQFDLNDRQQLAQALRGLAALGLYETYDVILVPELLTENADFVLEKLASLVFREEPDLDTAEAILNGSYSTKVAKIPVAYSVIWRGVVADRKGSSPDALDKGIVEAVQESGARQWDYLMTLMPRVATPQQLLLFYRELFEHSGRHPVITARYLRIAYAEAEDAELARLARFIQLEPFSGDPQTLSFLIYLKLIYGESPEGSRVQAERLVADQPFDIAFLISLANTYAQSDRQDYARRLLAFWNHEESLQALPPFLQLSYVMATGQKVALDPKLFRTVREREILEQLLRSDPSEES